MHDGANPRRRPQYGQFHAPAGYLRVSVVTLGLLSKQGMRFLVKRYDIILLLQ